MKDDEQKKEEKLKSESRSKENRLSFSEKAIMESTIVNQSSRLTQMTSLVTYLGVISTVVITLATFVVAIYAIFQYTKINEVRDEISLLKKNFADEIDKKMETKLLEFYNKSQSQKISYYLENDHFRSDPEGTRFISMVGSNTLSKENRQKFVEKAEKLLTIAREEKSSYSKPVEYLTTLTLMMSHLANSREFDQYFRKFRNIQHEIDFSSGMFGNPETSILRFYYLNEVERYDNTIIELIQNDMNRSNRQVNLLSSLSISEVTFNDKLLDQVSIWIDQEPKRLQDFQRSNNIVKKLILDNNFSAVVFVDYKKPNHQIKITYKGEPLTIYDESFLGEKLIEHFDLESKV